MRYLATCFLTFALGLLTIAPAHAQGAVSLGTLTCSGGEGVGLILGSSKSYDCNFAPSNGEPAQRYRASVNKIGLDVGITGKTVIVWTVLATSNTLKPGVLAGDYAGAAADASIGVGGGAKVLVGGSANQITLQPLSVQGQTGLNLAVGIAGMTLR